MAAGTPTGATGAEDRGVPRPVRPCRAGGADVRNADGRNGGGPPKRVSAGLVGGALIVAGTTLRPDQVRVLAAMLDGELAAKLERAVTNKNSIVALTVAERERIVTVLDAEPPSALVELHGVLVKQLAQQKRREAQDLQTKRNQERVRPSAKARRPGARVPRARSRSRSPDRDREGGPLPSATYGSRAISRARLIATATCR